MITQQEIGWLINHCGIWEEPTFMKWRDRKGNPCLCGKLMQARGAAAPHTDTHLAPNPVREQAFADVSVALRAGWAIEPVEEIRRRLVALLE